MKQEELPEQTPAEDKATSLRFKQEKVTDFDIFKFGKTLVYVCLTILVLLTVARFVLEDTKARETAWQLMLNLLSNAIFAVIGLYFGKKAS